MREGVSSCEGRMCFAVHLSLFFISFFVLLVRVGIKSPDNKITRSLRYTLFFLFRFNDRLRNTPVAATILTMTYKYKAQAQRTTEDGTGHIENLGRFSSLFPLKIPLPSHALWTRSLAFFLSVSWMAISPPSFWEHPPWFLPPRRHARRRRPTSVSSRPSWKPP